MWTGPLTKWVYSGKHLRLQRDICRNRHTAPDLLRRFRILVLELHGLRGFNDPAIFAAVLEPFLSKLDQDFVCVHVGCPLFCDPGFHGLTRWVCPMASSASTDHDLHPDARPFTPLLHSAHFSCQSACRGGPKPLKRRRPDARIRNRLPNGTTGLKVAPLRATRANSGDIAPRPRAQRRTLQMPTWPLRTAFTARAAVIASPSASTLTAPFTEGSRREVTAARQLRHLPAAAPSRPAPYQPRSRHSHSRNGSAPRPSDSLRACSPSSAQHRPV